MTLVPKSLFGRNVLLIVALIALGQVISAVSFGQLVQRPRLHQLAVITTGTIESVKAGLEALPAGARAAFIAQLNAKGVIRILPATEKVGGFSLPRTLAHRLLIRELAGLLHDDQVEVVWKAESQGTLWIRILLAGEPYWITASGLNQGVALPWAWMGASLLSALLAIAGAYLIQRRINRPLGKLVEASQEIGRGDAPAPLPENGPLEIATVSRSFNQMTASLAQLDRERTIMLAGVSHDLRTPLSKLRLAIEILRDKAEPELIDTMTRSTEEMDAVIDQFLDFARAGSAEATATADLNTLVMDTAAAYLDQGHVFTLRLAPIPPLTMRPQAMRRLVTNLIENAVRYGQPEYAIETGATEHTVWLRVLDRGPGISGTEAEALKQPFRRSDAARSGKPGAGLGLAIVERIAKLHCGRLDLLPRDGGGLEVRVEIPLRPRQVPH